MTSLDLDMYNESYLKFLVSSLKISPVGHSAIVLPGIVEGIYRNNKKKGGV